MLKQEEHKPTESAPVEAPETPGMVREDPQKTAAPSLAEALPPSAPEPPEANLNRQFSHEPDVVAEPTQDMVFPEHPSAVVAAEPERQPPSERWIQLVEALCEKAPKLAGLMRNAIPDALEGPELRLGFRNVGFLQMLTAENMSELAHLLKEFLGREVRVHCLQEPQASPFRTVLEQEEFVEQQECERRCQEARRHPLVQNILATFPGSEITEIRLH